MRKGLYTFCLLIASVLLLSSGSLLAQPGTWAISAGAGARDYVSDILVDDNGNAYITGYFTDSISFENTTLYSLGKNDVFIAKYDLNGSLMWAQRQGWLENEFARNLSFDVNGNILVAGDYQDSTILAGQTILSLDTLWYGPYAQTYDVFILTLQPDGTNEDVFTDGWFSSERVYDLEVDGNADRVMAVTWHTFSWWENGIWGRGYHDAMIVSLDSSASNSSTNINSLFRNRSHAWGAQFDEAREVEVIGDSLYVLAGMFQDTCYFRDSTVFGVTDFEDDIFIKAQNDTAGYKWALWGGSPARDRVTGMDHDANANLYVSGTFNGDYTLGGQTITGGGNLDAFLAKVDAAGQVVWNQAFGGSGFDAIEDLVCRAGGDIIVTGYFQGEITLGSTTLQANDSLDQNVFVASVSSVDGSVNWAWSGGGTGIDAAHSLSLNPADEIYVMGTYNGTATFGQQVLTSEGSDDIFILKMDVNGAVSTAEPNVLASGLSIYPNPSQGQFSLSLELQETSLVTVEIFDLTGNLIYQADRGKLPKGQHQFDLELQGTAAGVYFLRLSAAGTEVSRRLLITP